MTDWFCLQKSTGIIESGIGGMTYILRGITLLLYITKPYLLQSTGRRFWSNVVYCWIFNFGCLFLPHYVWLRKIQNDNNYYTSCLNSTKTIGRFHFLHQLLIHPNTLLCVIIHLLYLNFPDDQWLCIFMILQNWTHKASYLIADQWC